MIEACALVVAAAAAAVAGIPAEVVIWAGALAGMLVGLTLTCRSGESVAPAPAPSVALGRCREVANTGAAVRRTTDRTPSHP